jgi:hypothetical protein
MVNLRLRKATARDSEFAYLTKKAAVGGYVEEVWGWDEVAFYERLGFSRTGESDTHVLMEKLP